MNLIANSISTVQAFENGKSSVDKQAYASSLPKKRIDPVPVVPCWKNSRILHNYNLSNVESQIIMQRKLLEEYIKPS